MRAGRRLTFATRTAMLTTGVAVVVVLIAGLVAAGLVSGAAEDESRSALAKQADLLAQSADLPAPPAIGRTTAPLPAATPDKGATAFDRLAARLGHSGVGVARVSASGSVLGADPRAHEAAASRLSVLRHGADVSAVDSLGGETVLVEARALAAGGSVLLVQRRADSRALLLRVVNSMVIALLAGLVVAAAAGLLLARRLTRPLRRVATAAHELAEGRRDVRLAPGGPAEIAEVADSLNRLATALETSEGRQREFLLSVSHELRTPLTAVKGFAESLADGVTSGEDVARVGETILSESARLERLVKDLLDLARLGAQDFHLDVTEVDLRALVEAAAEVWRVRCDAEGVWFWAELPPDPVPVATDGVRIRQVLDGLAENALRVTPAGRPIVFAMHANDQEAVIEVRDGGPGLSVADCVVAFERGALFQRYRGIRQVGSGVGLALVHGLTVRLGGTAEAGHAPEGGARFTIRLPLMAMPGHLTIRLPSMPPPGHVGAHAR